MNGLSQFKELLKSDGILVVEWYHDQKDTKYKNLHLEYSKNVYENVKLIQADAGTNFEARSIANISEYPSF